MAKMDTLSEFKKFCDECCNCIFQIRQEYERKKILLRNDYESGLVSEEDYQRLLTVSIDEFVDSKYTLSQEDVAFIQSYAHLNKSGELMADLLKPFILEQLHLLENIYQSVQVYAHYGMLTLEDRKKQFAEEVMRVYQTDVDSLKHKLNVIKRTYGSRYQETEQYREYETSCTALKKEAEARKHAIAISTEEMLNIYLGQFFGIDYRYYEWFKQMSLKEEYASGFIFKEHVSLAQKVASTSEEVSTLSQSKKDLGKELSEVFQSFSSFSEGMLQFDMNAYLDKHKIPFFKFLGKKVDLSSVFNSLSEISGVLPYLRTFEEEKEATLSLPVCYDKYVQLIYSGDVSQVDASTFIRSFMNNVVHYYQTKIIMLEEEIMKVQTTLENQLQTLCTLSQRNFHQAELQNDMVTQLDKEEQIHLEDFGFSEEGVARIYHDLKEITYKEYTSYPSVGFSFKKCH